MIYLPWAICARPPSGPGWYNAVHNYAWAALLGVAALLTIAFSLEWSLWLAMVAFAWAFHVGVDRMLGYGLKLPDAFTHTHLGWIGKDRHENMGDSDPDTMH